MNKEEKKEMAQKIIDFLNSKEIEKKYQKAIISKAYYILKEKK